jgi:hypothetical protein
MPLTHDTNTYGKPCRKAMKRMTSKLARMRCVELGVCPDCGGDLVAHGIRHGTAKKCPNCSKIYNK